MGPYNQLIKHNIRLLLLAALVDGLVAYSIHGAVDHPTVVFDDLRDRVALGKVDRYATDLLRRLQPLWHLIDYVDLAGSADDSRVRGHKSYRSGAEDCDTFASLEPSKDQAMPACREDIG